MSNQTRLKESSTFWEKKTTTANLNNDRFTFYENMDKTKDEKNKFYNNKKLRDEEIEDDRKKIHNVRNTLNSLHVSGHGNFGSELEWSRSIQGSRGGEREREKYLFDDGKDIVWEDNCNESDDFTESSNYTFKLSILKNRLQQISNKTYENESSKTTKRQQKQYRIEPRSIDYNEAVEISNSKNTAPIQYSIREEKDPRISSTLQMPSKSHKNTNTYRESSEKMYYDNINEKEYEFEGISQSVIVGKIQSHQKKREYDFIGLHPTYSEEIDVVHGNKNSINVEDMELHKLRKGVELEFSGKRNNKSQTKEQSNRISSKNQSSQSTKRRDSSSNTNMLISKKNTQKIESSHNLSKSNLNKSMSIHTQSISKNPKVSSPIFSIFPVSSVHQPYSYKNNNLKTETNNRQAHAKSTKKGFEVSKAKIHRASIIGLDFWKNISSKEIGIFTSSLDYTAKYTLLNLEDSEESFYRELHKHRGQILCQKLFNKMFITAGKDLFLKYSNFEESFSYNSAFAQEYPIKLNNENMFKLDSLPTQIARLDDHRIIIGCVNKMLIFDLEKAKIEKTKTIKIEGKIMENGNGSNYLGSSNKLSVIDYRSDELLIDIVNGLNNVKNWISHPNEQFFLLHQENSLITLDLRQSRNAIPKLSFKEETTIVSHTWPSSKTVSLLLESPLTANSTKTIIKEWDLLPEYSNRETERSENLEINWDGEGYKSETERNISSGLVGIYHKDKKYFCTDKNGYVHIVN